MKWITFRINQLTTNLLSKTGQSWTGVQANQSSELLLSHALTCHSLRPWKWNRKDHCHRVPQASFGNEPPPMVGRLHPWKSWQCFVNKDWQRGKNRGGFSGQVHGMRTPLKSSSTRQEKFENHVLTNAAPPKNLHPSCQMRIDLPLSKNILGGGELWRAKLFKT